MSSLAAHVDGIGLIGPGLADWPAARAVLRGEAPYLEAPPVVPAPAALPPAERRRTGQIVKLSLAVGFEAVAASALDPAGLATVFSSSGADGDNCHAICEALASADRQISPTRFHNSVHNAASGYWGIASGAMAPSTSICTFEATFGAGLLEAASQVTAFDRPVLLIACDTPYPEPLHSVRPLPGCFGVALVLSPQRSARTLARIEVAAARNEVSTIGDPALETLRRSIPAARGLPLLAAVARGTATSITLDYLDGLQLATQVAP
jgi:hypothetical protein